MIMTCIHLPPAETGTSGGRREQHVPSVQGGLRFGAVRSAPVAFSI